MKAKSRQSGLTMMEMTVVVAIVALLTAFSLPAVRTLFNSLAIQGSTRAVIGAALASARAIAAKEQRYAGIRFQNDLAGNQYMIFIIYDTDIPNLVAGNLGCRAVEGIEPIKLPETIGVMDSRLIEEKINLDPNWEPSGAPELTDLTTFSILFSQSGKLVIHDLWVRNRDGVNDNSSRDDIFNIGINVSNQIGMFPQDESGSIDLHREISRNSFIIYEKDEFRQAYNRGQGYSGYLVQLVPIFINPYTGTIISMD